MKDDYVWFLAPFAFVVVGLLAFCVASDGCEQRGGRMTSDGLCVQPR